MLATGTPSVQCFAVKIVVDEISVPVKTPPNAVV